MERESAREVCMGQPSMSGRIETSEARVFRHARQAEILCRLTYEVTRFSDGLFRWFVLGIEELGEVEAKSVDDSLYFALLDYMLAIHRDSASRPASNPGRL